MRWIGPKRHLQRILRCMKPVNGKPAALAARGASQFLGDLLASLQDANLRCCLPGVSRTQPPANIFHPFGMANSVTIHQNANTPVQAKYFSSLRDGEKCNLCAREKVLPMHRNINNICGPFGVLKSEMRAAATASECTLRLIACTVRRDDSRLQSDRCWGLGQST